MGNIGRTIIKVLLPLIVLAGAVGGAVGLVKSRPKPEKKERPEQAYSVRTTTAKLVDQQIDVRAQGSVEAARRTNVVPQVQGTLTKLHPELYIGGFIKKGDVLARVDPTDYKINLAESETSLATAKAQLAQEQGQQAIAKKEWELFKADNAANVDPSLALRAPQLEIAKVSVAAAEARLQRAKVSLRRTTIRAPFNALVQSEAVEINQVVGANSVIATLIGTDEFWVRASIPLDKLELIKIPGFNAKNGEGSMVAIEQDLGGKVTKRQGQVLRLLGELDQVGRMAQVLVSVKDPLGLSSDTDAVEPLLLGSYVSVVLGGSASRSVVEIPRQAIHNGDQVWLYGGDGRLEVKDVVIAARRPQTVLIASGVESGDEIILSQIGAPVPGMKLERQDDSSAPAKKPASKEAGQ